MSYERDGGPAFPDDRSQVGMSLRDYFAAKAMQGLLAFGGWRADGKIEGETGSPCESVVRNAYRYADAMLAEGVK